MIRTYKILRDAVKIFFENHCFERSAAISFFAFLSLIPVLFFIASVLGFLFGTSAEMLETVIRMAKVSLPYLSERIIKELHGLTGAWKTFGWLSIIALILSAELVFNVMADALTAVFDVREGYGFFRKRITNVLVLLMAIFSAFVSIVVTAALGILKNVNVTFFDTELTRFLIDSLAMKYLLPFVLVVCAVTVVYKIFSGPNLYLRYAFYGGIIFAFLWELAKQCFALYIFYFPTYNRVYGSLGTLMMLLVWMFFSANIFLFCASIARAASKNYYWRRL